MADYDESRLTVVDLTSSAQTSLHSSADKTATTKQFRERQRAQFLSYEAMRDFPRDVEEVETPLEMAAKRVLLVRRLLLFNSSCCTWYGRWHS